MRPELFRTLAPLYWDCGFRVLPLEPRTKRPAQELKGWPGFASSPLSADKRAEFINRYPDRGLGILTGTELSDGYRLGAIDVDQDALVAAVQVVLGAASCAKRGKKGLTIFVRYDEDLKSTKIVDASGGGAIDVLLGAKFSVLPPSIHPETGTPYAWIGSALLDIELAALPIIGRETLRLLRTVIGSPHAQVITSGIGTHDAGVAFAAQLVAHGCEDDQITGIVTALLPAGYDGNSLAELPGWIESAREKGFADTVRGGAGGGKRENPTPADSVLAALTELGVDLFHDERKRGFISVPTEAGGILTYPVNSSMAAAVLRQVFYRLTGKALKDAALSDIAAVLSARAIFDGRCEKIWSRIGRQGTDVLVDLGRPDGRIVLITGGGYQILARSPVRFIRTPGMLELPEPVPGGRIEELRDLLALPDETYNLVLAFLINVLRPGGPYLCLLIEGEQGSGKSFLSSVLRRLIDPNQAEKLRLPENERDLMVLADALFMLVFDNSSGMSANVSDALCSLATGSGYASRKLYTDGELYMMNATRPFIINGISDVATKSDLIERVIPVKLVRMEDNTRRTEGDMNAALEALRPRLLGAIYDVIACAIRNEAVTATPSGVRMIDAARWLAAAEPATGLPTGTIVEALMQCQNERIIERTNNDPVVVALRTTLEEGRFEGTIAGLLETIKPDYPPRFFPDTPLKLSKHMDKIRTGLKLIGIHYERGQRSNKGQTIRVWLDGQENDAPAPPRRKLNFGPPDAPNY
ncbi:bifunctional DNA primase/polymerase [Methylobacterium sp. A52T]